jgi:glycosyltransferase involved in cell wall biosynthesis
VFQSGVLSASQKKLINMNTPLVTVVVPVYNEEKYLKKCLESLSSQQYTNIEIIVIDDGSTDRSVAIIKKFNVQILHQKHKGPGAARNKGIKEAKGEIIVLADADMWYDQDYVTNLIKPILAKKSVGTFIKEEFVANPDNIWSRCWSINAGLPFDRRLPIDYKETDNAFRAILKKYAVSGYNEKEGYTDDSSLSKKIGKIALNAPGAKSYHYNPSSLCEVFYSARWIGRSNIFYPNINNFFRFSPFNSLRVSLKYLFQKAPIAIVPFKFIFDAGVFVGIFFNDGKTAK